jgi:hypothetical protein
VASVIDNLSDDQRKELAALLMPVVNAAVRAYAELPESIRAAAKAEADAKRSGE